MRYLSKGILFFMVGGCTLSLGGGAGCGGQGTTTEELDQQDYWEGVAYDEQNPDEVVQDKSQSIADQEIVYVTAPVSGEYSISVYAYGQGEDIGYTMTLEM